MTYPTALLMFGIPLRAGRNDAFAEFRDEMIELPEVFEQYLSDNCSLEYFAIQMTSIPCLDPLYGDELIALLAPKQHHKDEYAALVQRLREEATPALYERLTAIAPKVFVIWGMS